MTLIDEIKKSVLKLSPEKQREALDFVAFLQLHSIKSPELERGERTKNSLNKLATMKTFSEFFRASPLAGIDLTRDKSLPRDGASTHIDTRNVGDFEGTEVDIENLWK